MSIFNHLPNEEVYEETEQFPCFSALNENEDGEFSTFELLNSKYHTVHDFQSPNLENKFNIFHSNVNGLKLDILTAFLTGAQSPPDVIGITETSEQKSTSFITNVSMQGYKYFFHTPTNSSKEDAVSILIACLTLLKE